MASDRPAIKNNKDFIKFLEENDIEEVKLTFTDLNGTKHVTTQCAHTLDDDTLTEGIYMDGSSIPGWKTIEQSDMNQKPDVSTVVIDPFAMRPTAEVFCTIHDPLTGDAYDRCPRSIAQKAEAYLKNTGLADTAYFGPEAEFFVFDDVKINADMNHVGVKINSEEGPYNFGSEILGGNMGHRPRVKGGYFPDAPVDSLGALRAEMIAVLKDMGVPVEKHHHEVAPSQCELGICFDTLTKTADNMVLYKHVVKNVAEGYGKTATFMPKPVFGDNGSGMHVHQSLFKSGKPMFAGDGYAGLSENCLYYIGGIIKHAKALNAFTNPTTNSYKRLVPGYEAPVLLAYSARNRSASCRIPFGKSPKAKRVEVRFPDPTANPYLAFSAMLMAGLDGIKNKIHPGDAMDENLYELPKSRLDKIPTVCGSLREALNALKKDHGFLLEGGVFTEDMIDAFIELRGEGDDAVRMMPHPLEFMLYYSA